MVMRNRRRGRGHHRPRSAQARPAGTAAAETPRTTAPPTGTRRKTVLVVEDNATIGGVTVALLREEGYRALRAWDGREALKVARDRKPDLIVLDLSLPYPEGLPILHELKAHREMNGVPLLVSSANSVELAPGDSELILEHIQRPIGMDRFINAIRRALGDPELDVPEVIYTGTVDSNLYNW